MKAIEKFVVLQYDKYSSYENVDECRFDLIHLLRLLYIIKWEDQQFKQQLFGGSQQCVMVIKGSPVNWGWKYDKEGRVWKIHWRNLPPIAESCQQLTRCGYMKEYPRRCRCLKLGLPCTQLCGCNFESISFEIS